MRPAAAASTALAVLRLGNKSVASRTERGGEGEREWWREKYRVTLVVAYLGWIDIDLESVRDGVE